MSDDWADEYERNILAIINAHGIAVQGVGSDETMPQFAYSVGLAPHEHPEIIIVGLPMGVAQNLLNDLAAQVRQGLTFQVGDEIHGLVRGFPVRMVEVIDSSELLTMANRIYRDGPEPLAALQVTFPDASGLWPWEDGSRVAEVPLLGPAAVEAVRVVRLDL